MADASPPVPPPPPVGAPLPAPPAAPAGAPRRPLWKRPLVVFPLVIVASAVSTAGVLMLLSNIYTRKWESRETVFRVVDLPPGTVDPAEWGKNYPRQYDSYKRTVDVIRTRHGGNEAPPLKRGEPVGPEASKLEIDPRLRVIYSGYPFSVDYREARGHAYMLSDQDVTRRTTEFKQPGACLHCHAAITPAYHQKGREAGIPDDRPREQLMKGFEVVCKMPLAEARGLVAHPVSCIDCHDPQSMQLRVTRPAFLVGIGELAKGEAPVPHLPSVERWRLEGRRGTYDPNADATRQEMRSLVCGQCHVEYYFQKDTKLVTYPWHNGLRADDIERYYEATAFTDWTHKDAGTPMLKAQHPEFEMWSQGIHARSGVSCADCHMPYVREGAVKVSDHHVRSPMLNVNRACQTCHRYPEEEIKARVEVIQGRTRELLDRAEDACVDVIRAIADAKARGATDEQLAEARKLHRAAQWRADFVQSENSRGFHASQEAARVLGQSIDLARQGQLKAATIKTGK
ncbi:MAG: ammonia-forming cytochrome c nitrite reductase subunit c552 [Planctomycetes bacterium]|nr:ammonia-forming cytochrome c nitrite reductase subunit c552 [Planctomycetota bacterium]